MASLKHNGTELARFKFTHEDLDGNFRQTAHVSMGSRGWLLRRDTVAWVDGPNTKGTWKRWERTDMIADGRQDVEGVSEKVRAYFKRIGWTEVTE